LHFHAGNFEDAVAEGEEALKLLQSENALLRYRTMAYLAGAQVALGRGLEPRTVELFKDVLHNYPTALKQLGVRVQAQVTFDADPFATEVAERLVESRRLDIMDNAPFRVHVSGSAKQLKMCLSSTMGFKLGCGERKFERPSPEDVQTAIDAFHTQAFAPMVALTSSDINSLDGSTVRANADEVLEGILGTDFKDKEEDEE
jgi:hypothetical protein